MEDIRTRFLLAADFLLLFPHGSPICPLRTEIHTLEIQGEEEEKRKKKRKKRKKRREEKREREREREREKKKKKKKRNEAVGVVCRATLWWQESYGVVTLRGKLTKGIKDEHEDEIQQAV